ncbi:YqgE/AlgH family protein [Dongshaea marina]|uniref:YqgE/AlgH family protein n=1 Tax=Dongshaea marina TaxID=2047966 RepID=UPI000D3E5906|nr:YqgE/AlgH family protein [Dongshaea marina]
MTNFENHFLIAMPTLKDPFFERSLVYLCEHREQGAMGLVVNIAIDISLKELLTQLDFHPGESPKLAKPVLQGGPISLDRGFVLHSPCKGMDSSIQLTDNLMVTTSKDILGVLGSHHEPSDYLVTLGYAGWNPGQLEQELKENVWLTIPADPALIFEVPIHQRWEMAARSLGIDIWQLSSQIGHA